MPRRLSAILLVSFVSFAFAQQEAPNTLRQAMLDLSNDGVLMDISAHPDDEDGATLAYYRMKYGVKTYSILFTRGEGGQNEKGPELYEELGVVRSRETEEAGRILGAEVHFLNFLDFGYAKTATETFRRWGGQREALRRLVYVIRKYKPDVIFTNHNTIDGHGHHQAVAITAIAAFDAAADSTYFPEQLREPGVILWQPRKLFFRTFGRSEVTADVSNAIEEMAPGRGITYLDIASEALRMHKTQGLERANLRAFTRGKSLYKLMRANSLYDQDSTTFFGGIDYFRDPSVEQLKGIRSALDRVHLSMPDDSLLETVAWALGQCDSIRRTASLSPLARRMVAHWEDEAARVAEEACGLGAEFHLDDSLLVARQRVGCELGVSCQRCMIGSVRWSFALPPGWSITEAAESAPSVGEHDVRRPYTLTVGDNALQTIPRKVMQYRSLELHQDIVATVSLTLNGERIWFTVSPAFEVAPAELIEASPVPATVIRSRIKEGAKIEYVIRNELPHKTAGRIGFRTPAGWSGDNDAFVIDSEDSTATGSLRVVPPGDIAPGGYLIQLRTELGSVPIGVSVVDAQVDHSINLGIIRSYDNTMEEAASTLGLRYSLLTDAEIASGSLAKYTTIVVDIRAYLVREALRAHNDRLLEYVHGGGNLIVMYQREQEWKSEYAPVQFRIGRRRVCSRDAPITILDASHPLMRMPNLITERDWEGWIQERGLYFPSEVPPQYVRLLSTADPDEAPLTTGYLVLRHGKGSYIYTSLVWYRQLKEGNPGAYRCFANMISYPAYRDAQ